MGVCRCGVGGCTKSGTGSSHLHALYKYRTHHIHVLQLLLWKNSPTIVKEKIVRKNGHLYPFRLESLHHSDHFRMWSQFREISQLTHKCSDQFNGNFNIHHSLVVCSEGFCDPLSRELPSLKFSKCPSLSSCLDGVNEGPIFEAVLFLETVKYWLGGRHHYPTKIKYHSFGGLMNVGAILSG